MQRLAMGFSAGLERMPGVFHEYSVGKVGSVLSRIYRYTFSSMMTPELQRRKAQRIASAIAANPI